MTELPKMADFDPYRPKVSLRRFTDPKIRLAIQEYILNRHTAAGIVSLAFVMTLLNGCAEMACKYAPGDNGYGKPPSERNCKMP